MASGLLLVSLVCCVILSHNLLAATARDAFGVGGDTFENQKNYYGTPSTPVATPAHAIPAPKGPSLCGSKCSGRHSHHRTPRPSCGTPTTPSITPVTPAIPLPTVSPPIPHPTPRPTPRPTPVPTPVVVPPVVNPPVLLPPPSPISVPGTPSAPFPFDPNTPPFTCDYWRNHPTIIWGVLGWWGTLGSAFGTTTLPGTSLPGLPGLPTPSDSLVQALSNTRNDGYGDLYREGVASFLNSVADPSKFPFSTKQVRGSFMAALSSDKAAASQARVFKLANENKLHHNP